MTSDFFCPCHLVLILALFAVFYKEHFEETQFEIKRADGRKLLKWNAVPTIPAKVYGKPEHSPDARDNPQCTSEQPVPLITVEVPGQPDERGQLLSAGDTEWQEALEPMVLYVDTTGAEGSASFEQRGKFFHQPSSLIQ